MTTRIIVMRNSLKIVEYYELLFKNKIQPPVFKFNTLKTLKTLKDPNDTFFTCKRGYSPKYVFKSKE